MNRMNRKFSAFIIVLTIAFLAIGYLQAVQAVEGSASNPGSATPGVADNTPRETVKLQNPLQGDGAKLSVGQLVEKFLGIFTYLVIILAVLAIIWVGFMFIMARGEPAKLTKLRDWLLWIVVGVAIVIGARIIVLVMINTLEQTGTVNQNVINSAKRAINE